MPIKNSNRLFVLWITMVFMFSLTQGGNAQQDPNAVEKIAEYTCGMHPSVRVSVEHYKKGDTKCPICFSDFTGTLKKKPSLLVKLREVLKG